MSNKVGSEDRGDRTRGFWKHVKNNILGPEDIYPSYQDERYHSNQRKVLMEIFHVTSE